MESDGIMQASPRRIKPLSTVQHRLAIKATQGIDQARRTTACCPMPPTDPNNIITQITSLIIESNKPMDINNYNNTCVLGECPSETA